MSTITLKIDYHDGRSEQRELTQGVYQIGRDSGHIPLGDPNTSARHAELQVQPGKVMIADVGSTNGTYDATGSRLAAPYQLRLGAPVRLGNTSLTLLTADGAAGGTRVMSAQELAAGPAAAAAAGALQPSPAAPPGFAPVGAPPGFAPPGSPPGFAPAGGPPGFNPAGQAPGFAPAGGPPGFDPSGQAPGFAPNAGFNPAGTGPGAGPGPAPGAAMAAAPGQALVASDDKLVGILAYLTLIGFVVAIIMHSNKKTELGAFHLRQALGYLLTSFAGGIVIGISSFVIMLVAVAVPLIGLVSSLLWLAYGLGMLALWVFGLMSAINGTMKPMPVVGAYYQKWFATAFR